jgi:hypothetical protein
MTVKRLSLFCIRGKMMKLSREEIMTIHFQEGKFIQKLTYSKTTLEIDEKRVPLHG